MAIDFELVEHRPVAGPGLTVVKVEFRPVPGEPVHSNIFHMQLYPTGRRLLIDGLGRLVTESGILVPPLPEGLFPDESPVDPFQREDFTRNNDAEMAANIEAYWERKLRAAAEGRPYSQHHRSTLNLQVGAGADDIRVQPWPTPTSNSQTILVGGHDSAKGFGGAMRFISVTIGQGDTIDSSVLTMTPDATQSDKDITTNIDAEDVDNADAIDDETEYDNAVRTTENVAYSGVKSWTVNVEEALTDMTAVTQEVVDRALWASGNAMVYFWEDNGSVSGDLVRAFQYEDDSTKAAKLDIDFTAGGAAVLLPQSKLIGQAVNRASVI